MSVAESDVVLAAFVEEARELLDSIEPDLSALPDGPVSADRLQRIRRTLHTVKGNCGFVGLPGLERIAHDAESLLAGFRAGMPVPPATVGDLLGMTSAMHRRLDAIDRDGRDLAPAGGSPEAQPGPADPATARSATAPARVHIEARLLDQLTRLVGDMAHMRGMVADQGGPNGASTPAGLGPRLDRFSRDLQRIVLDARTEPVAHLWRGAPQLVHDLARECGKQVVLRMDGGDTGIDRMLVDALREPLVHLLRNAVAHGIEDPATRTASAKEPAGRIRLGARQLDGQVRIDVADDGAGIPVERLRHAAVTQRFMTADEAAAAADGALIDLVFRPGLTTATRISSAAGRGVGLDAVRAAVERVGGAVTVTTLPGRGTTFSLTLPCALAIRRVLRVQSSGLVYAIPTRDIVEMTRIGLNGSDAGTAGDTHIMRWRDVIMPLVSLRNVIGEPASARQVEPAEELIVVIRTGNVLFGLAVGALLDVRDIVVTPFMRRLEGRTVFAGAAIERDGAMALLLDPARLMRRAGVTGVPDQPEEQDAASVATPSASWVTYRALNGARRAVPVTAVARLEAISASTVRRAGARWLASSRDLPLELLDWPADREASAAALPVIVCTGDDRTVGLVAARILEIDALPVPAAWCDAGREGIRYAVADGEITEMLDRPGLLGSTPLHPGNGPTS